jgi:5-methylcytosine-specific restriction endonuclease McrA
MAGRHRAAHREILKQQLADRDGRRCFYCGDPNIRLRWLTLDHVWPQAFGGTNDLSNLVLACAPCNNRKGSTISLKALLHLFQFTPCACRAKE